MCTMYYILCTLCALTTFFWTLMQSQSGSIHSPHRIRNIIMKEWKKSRKFHLGNSEMQQWDKNEVHLHSARTIQINIRSKR